MTEALLLSGGCRSGKSALAVRWAEAQAPERLFLATATIHDEEMRRRVQRHQRERGAGWHTLECPLSPLAALKTLGGETPCAAVLDCVTLWLSNLLACGASDAEILPDVDGLAACLRQPPVPVAVVTNEVGMGIVPSSPLGRRFRDLAGEANQKLAAACPQVLLVSCGLPLVLKGTFFLPEAEAR